MHLKKCNGIILARVVMMEERQEAQSMKAPCAGCQERPLKNRGRSGAASLIASAENIPFSSQV